MVDQDTDGLHKALEASILRNEVTCDIYYDRLSNKHFPCGYNPILYFCKELMHDTMSCSI